MRQKFLGYQVLLLGRHQVRTIDAQERLAALHELAGCVGVYLLNPAGEADLNVGKRRFVCLDVSDVRISSRTCRYSTMPVFTPMLCIRCGVSVMGARFGSGAGAVCATVARGLPKSCPGLNRIRSARMVPDGLAARRSCGLEALGVCFRRTDFLVKPAIDARS